MLLLRSDSPRIRIRSSRLLIAGVAACATLISGSALADYPIASHRYLADPASLVHDGRVYLYCSNDDDNVVAGGGDNGYKMASIVLVSSSDLKNWTDHGEVIRAPRDASWAYNTWAPAVIERNGTFYMYFGNSGGGLGVAKSSSPTGPFKDAKGSALITGSTPGASGQNMWLFDPSVFIDDDDQAYLYFGGNGDSNVRVIKLNQDMVSVSGSAMAITAKGFFEASWMHKRNGVYYFSYSTNPANGMRIDYLTSSNPMTGFTYAGVVGDQPPSNNNNNNHASEFEMNGVWYHAYHNRIVSNEADEPTTYRRNIALDALTYGGDGKIVPVTYTRDGLEQLHSLDPYERVEAETFNAQDGIETEPCEAGGMNLANVENGDWVRLRGVDFGAGAESFTARVASAGQGGSIELRLDAKDGTLVGTCDVASTGGWQEWSDASCAVDGAVGEHDLYLVFTGGDSFLFNVDSWQFTALGGAGTGGAGNTGGSSSVGGTFTGGASNSSGGASASGGVASVGGAVGVGGTGAVAPNDAGTSDGDDSEDAAGCGCHAVNSGPLGLAWALPALLASLVVWRRRLRPEHN